MQVVETSAEGLKREFKVLVPAGEVQAKIESKLGELGRKLKLPGFRPGKVPLPVLRQRYGRSVLGEVVEQAVSDSSTRLMNERGLRAAGQPRIEIISTAEGGDLEYKMAVELIPEISPIDLKSIKLERLTVEFPDSEIDDALARLAKRHRKTEPTATPRPAQTGDVVVIDFVGRIDGKEFEGGASTGYNLELGSGTLIPGLEDGLVGSSVGDHRSIGVTFPADYPNPDTAGRHAVFEVDVREIREFKETEISDGFAKTVGAENLQALREAMRGRISSDYGAVTRARIKRQLLDILAGQHQFEVPVGLVDTEFNAIWTQIENDRKAGRLDPEDQGKSDDDLRREYRDIAVRRVKLGLLLSEIGRLNNIQVANEELTRAVVNEARRFPGQERKIVEYYQKSPQAMLQLRAPIYEDKVVDFILELADVSDRKITPDELQREVGAAEATAGKA